MITAPQIADAADVPTPPSPITAEDRAAVCADYFGPDANLLVDVRRWRETGEVGEADELQRLERLALGRAAARESLRPAHQPLTAIARQFVATAAEWAEAFGEDEVYNRERLNETLSKRPQPKVNEHGGICWGVLMDERDAAHKVIHQIADALGLVDWSDGGRYVQATDCQVITEAQGLSKRRDVAERERIESELALDDARVEIEQLKAQAVLQHALSGAAFQVTREEWDAVQRRQHDGTGLPPIIDREAVNAILAARPSAPAPSGAGEVPVDVDESLVATLYGAFVREREHSGLNTEQQALGEALEVTLGDRLRRHAPSAPSAQAWTRDTLDAVCDAVDPSRTLCRSRDMEDRVRAALPTAPVASAQGGELPDTLSAMVLRKKLEPRIADLERDLAAERAAHEVTRAKRWEAAERRVAEAEASRNLAAAREQDSEKRAAELERERDEAQRLRVELGDVWEERDTLRAELAKVRELNHELGRAHKAAEAELAACKAKLEALAEACDPSAEQYNAIQSDRCRAKQLVQYAVARVAYFDRIRAALKPTAPVAVEADPGAPKTVEALPDFWDARRRAQGKADLSRCGAELRAALAAQLAESENAKRVASCEPGSAEKASLEERLEAAVRIIATQLTREGGWLTRAGTGALQALDGEVEP